MTATTSFAALGLVISIMRTCAVPLTGPNLATRSDNVAALNEPCYVHDAACDGYPVCCVTAGTCISQHSGTISSNTAYYEGGCQSLSSSRTSWSNSACTQQGECLIQHIEVCKGGTTRAGFMTTVPTATLDRFMAGSCGQLCPTGGVYGHSGGYGGGATVTSTASTTTTDTTTSTTITSTTTTTIITNVQGSVTITVSDVAAASASVNMSTLVMQTFSDMTGVHSSLITLTMPTVAATMTICYDIHVSNLHSMTATEVQNAITGQTDAEVNRMLAERIGTCSYTLTGGGPPGTGTCTGTGHAGHDHDHTGTGSGTGSGTIGGSGTGTSSYSIGLSPTIISMVLPFVAVVVGTVLA